MNRKLLVLFASAIAVAVLTVCWPTVPARAQFTPPYAVGGTCAAMGGDLTGTCANATVAKAGGQAISLGGALTTGGAFTQSGAFATTITSTATTNSTLPSGTHSLAPLDSPSFTTPTLGVATVTSINKFAFTAPTTAFTFTPIGDNLTLNLWGGVPHTTQSVTLPVSDLIAAHGGDTTINSLTATNTAGNDAAGQYQNFATTWSEPANFWTAGRSARICAQWGFWSSSTPPTYIYQLVRGASNQLATAVGQLTQSASRSGQNMETCWTMSATDTGAHVFTSTENGVSLLTTSGIGSSANGTAQPNNWGTGANTISLGIQYTATGILSGTCNDAGNKCGIATVTGTIGQTCALASFNNGNSGGTATVALTGTNVIANGTAIVVTNTGQGSTSAATTATASNGTATCTGTAALNTVLGGAQGNGVWLQALHIDYLN